MWTLSLLMVGHITKIRWCTILVKKKPSGSFELIVQQEAVLRSVQNISSQPCTNHYLTSSCIASQPLPHIWFPAVLVDSDEVCLIRWKLETLSIGSPGGLLEFNLHHDSIHIIALLSDPTFPSI
ncbi:hypothetical protein PGTUg99_005896 [Puccinia graminis f. sp. tritici]|uniref:Uncharacterized protein n=1 Tax=Puccinia graminis f. sp. tritici TaxID=56615 RepID=A0A5B0NVS3_PUCGR|nr:hypothetical protein PGTUg99_005896 [Puccinia graminis f. sp. tritici]